MSSSVVNSSENSSHPTRDRNRAFRRYQRIRQHLTDAAMDAGSFLYSEPPSDRNLPAQVESLYTRRVGPSFALLKRIRSKRVNLTGTRDASKIKYRTQEPFLLMFNEPTPENSPPAVAAGSTPPPAIPSFNLPLDLDCRISASALLEPAPHPTPSGSVIIPGSRLLSDLASDETHRILQNWLIELRMLGISSLVEPSLVKASKSDEPDNSGHSLSASKRRELQREREVSSLIELPLFVMQEQASKRLGDSLAAQKSELSSLLESSASLTAVNPVQVQNSGAGGQMSLSMLTNGTSSAANLISLSSQEAKNERMKESIEKMRWNLIRAEEAKDQIQFLEELRPSKKLRL